MGLLKSLFNEVRLALSSDEKETLEKIRLEGEREVKNYGVPDTLCNKATFELTWLFLAYIKKREDCDVNDEDDELRLSIFTEEEDVRRFRGKDENVLEYVTRCKNTQLSNVGFLNTYTVTFPDLNQEILDTVNPDVIVIENVWEKKVFENYDYIFSVIEKYKRKICVIVNVDKEVVSEFKRAWKGIDVIDFFMEGSTGFKNQLEDAKEMSVILNRISELEANRLNVEKASVDENAENWEYVQKRYKEAFEYPVKKQGVTQDALEFVLGGGFWGASKVIRHVFGKNNVYETYAYEIIENGCLSLEERMEEIKKATDYAIGNKDFMQSLRFLYYAAMYRKDNNAKLSICYNCAIHCYNIKSDMPRWMLAECPYVAELADMLRKQEKISKKTASRIIMSCSKLFFQNDYYEPGLYLFGLSIWETPMESNFLQMLSECKKDEKVACEVDFEKVLKALKDRGCYTNL